MRFTPRLMVALILPTALLSTGCGGKSGSSTAAAPAASTTGAVSGSSAAPSAAGPSTRPSSSSATAPSGGSAAAGSVGAVSVRFVNLYTTKQKQPGPALDIYDTLMGQAGKPLLTGVAYGTVSTYVHPTALPGGLIQLYALPTGEDPVAKASDAKGLNVVQQASHAQETIRIAGDPTADDSVPLAGLNFSTILEKGSDNGTNGPAAPLPASGHGQILVDKSAFTVLVPTNQPYLLIDSLCAPPLNGETTLPGVPYIFATDGKAPESSEAVFDTTPGTHQVSVDIESPTAAPTCAQLTTKQSTSTVTVAAGQQVLAFLYGTSPTDAHLVYAPIPS